MKPFFKLSLLFCLFVCSPVSLFCENMQAVSSVEGSVLLVPTDVYVGDTAEIRFTFSSASLFGVFETSIKETGTEFIDRAWSNNTELEDFDLLSAALLKVDSTKSIQAEQYGIEKYVIVLEIVPWVTGSLDVPTFNVLTAFGLEDAFASSSKTLVTIPPVTISSIVQKMQIKSLQPPTAPVIIPGTTWIVYLLILLSVILIFLTFLLIMRFKHVQKWWQQIGYRIFLSRNYYKTIKTLTLLEKKSSDIGIKAFASGVTNEIRRYMQTRFGVHFMAVETRKLCAIFTEVTGATVSEKATQSIEVLQSVCIRLDYIKFSNNEESSFTDSCHDIIQRVVKSLSYLEKSEDSEDEL